MPLLFVTCAVIVVIIVISTVLCQLRVEHVDYVADGPYLVHRGLFDHVAEKDVGVSFG